MAENIYNDEEIDTPASEVEDKQIWITKNSIFATTGKTVYEISYLFFAQKIALFDVFHQKKNHTSNG